MTSVKPSDRIEKERLIERANEICADDSLTEAEIYSRLSELTSDRRMLDYLMRHFYEGKSTGAST